MLRSGGVPLKGGGVFDGFGRFDGSPHPQWQQTTDLEKEALQHTFCGFAGFGAAPHPP